jgi:signal transduction histidine kinase
MSKYSSKEPSASSEIPASTFSYKLLFQAQTLEMIGSPNQMRQILINLIKNAIEASSAHCEITIICHSLEQHDDPWVRIQIIDNGPGIPQTHMDQIFMPFYSDKFGSGKNMGIGLSLVQNMVDKAGGHIFAHSGSKSFQDHVGHDKHIPPSLRSDIEDVSHRQNIGCIFSLEFPRCKESN